VTDSARPDSARPDSARAIDPRELEAAFSLFNEASTQLATAYQDLQGRVDRLAAELAVANGELKRQYLEKEALSERLELLLDALPGGVLVLDGDSRIVKANPAARYWLGGDPVGAEWPALMASRLVAPPGAREASFQTSDGQRWLALSESPFDASGGRILLLNDVTEATRLQQQLEHHKRLSAMGEMAAGLAHQLRTPLASALLHAANLSRPDLDETDRTRFSERVRERLKHLERMIQDMLMFVRSQPLGDEVFPMDAVLREVAQILEPQMAGRGLDFIVQGDDIDARLRGSRKAITGVLVNLLENAMQATESGGSVTLSAAAAGVTATIAVQDTGRGIDPGIQERLFEPFFTTRQEGTGLGLAIVRNVVEAHGGEVSVVSSPGAGSVFTVNLPVTLEAVAA
jgi:two-component system sensor histidine kinase FlrB